MIRLHSMPPMIRTRLAALAAGVASSRYVERLLKADRRHPFLDAHAEDGLGEHGNLRGPAYYN